MITPAQRAEIRAVNRLFADHAFASKSAGSGGPSPQGSHGSRASGRRENPSHRGRFSSHHLSYGAGSW